MVYESFLSRQFDYLYFVYGISLFLLALASQSSGRLAGTRMRWGWLTIFAAVHGSYELTELTAYVVGDNTPFAVVRFVLLATSFILLLEFGRASTFGEKGRLVLLAPVALSLIGVRSGLASLNSYTGYFLATTAGLWACVAFFRASRADDAGRPSLMATGVCIASYAIAEGFLPANGLSLGAFGIPAQLVKLALIFSATISLLFFCRSQERAGTEGGVQASPQRYYHPIIMVLAILAAGWLVSEAVGRHFENQARSNLLSRTLTAAASILPDRVAALTGTPADEGKPEFEHLRADLVRIKAVNPDCRFVYLMGMKDDKEIFLVDAEPKGSKDYSTPGDAYPDATPQEIEDYKKGQPKVYKPYTDSWGTWVSGAASITDPADGKPIALFGMDIAADEWMHTIALSRFFCIIITFGMSMLGIVLYTAWHRGREAAEQGVALRLAEQRLADGKEIERQRNDFYAMVSHDLKSPLAAIRGFSELLLEKGPVSEDPESAAMLNNIRKGSRKVLDMVNDFLTVSRSDSGSLTLNERLEDIGGMVSEVIEEVGPSAGKKDIKLCMDAPKNLPRVVCDRVHLERAITNLLNNAVNYTPHGGTVSVKVEKALAEGKDFVCIAVTDTGPGVQPEEKDKIFDKYYRSARTSGLKGSGLGLAIVKAVVAAHGGKVEFESADGKGSTFSISIPVKGY